MIQYGTFLTAFKYELLANRWSLQENDRSRTKISTSIYVASFLNVVTEISKNLYLVRITGSKLISACCKFLKETLEKNSWVVENHWQGKNSGDSKKLLHRFISGDGYVFTNFEKWVTNCFSPSCKKVVPCQESFILSWLEKVS